MLRRVSYTVLTVCVLCRGSGAETSQLHCPHCVCVCCVGAVVLRRVSCTVFTMCVCCVGAVVLRRVSYWKRTREQGQSAPDYRRYTRFVK